MLINIMLIKKRVLCENNYNKRKSRYMKKENIIKRTQFKYWLLEIYIVKVIIK